MILPEAVSAIIPSVEDINSNGTTLVPVEDSPLHKLIASMSSDPISLESIEKQLHTCTSNEERTVILNDIVNLVSDSVTKSSHLVKETILPHIRRVIESVKAKQHDVDKNVIPFKVSFSKEFPILSLQTLSELVGSFVRHDPETLTGKSLGDYDHDEVLERIKYSDTDDFNSTLTEGLLADDGLLLDVVCGIIIGSSHISNYLKEPIVLAALLIFVQNIEDPKDGVESTLSEYRQQIRAITHVAASNLAKLITIENGKVKSLKLYDYSSPAMVNEIILDRVVLEHMIKTNGVTIEMILGNEFTNRKYASGSELVRADVQGNLLKIYEAEVAKLKASVNANIESESRRLLYSAIMEDSRRVCEDSEKLNELNDTRESLLARTRQVCLSLNEIRWDSTSDENLVAAAIACIHYSHTDGPLLLELMELVTSEDPEVEQELIGEHAIIRRVCLWTSNMINRLEETK